MTIEELLAEIDLLKAQLRSQEEMQRLLMVVVKHWVARVVELEEESQAQPPMLIGAELANGGS